MTLVLVLGSLALFAINPASADAQELAAGADASPIFLDAEQTSFNRDMSRQIFRGDVVAIGGGAMLAADEIKINRETQVLEAKWGCPSHYRFTSPYW